MVRVRVFESEPAPLRPQQPSADSGPAAFVGAGQMGAPYLRKDVTAALRAAAEAGADAALLAAIAKDGPLPLTTDSH